MELNLQRQTITINEVVYDGSVEQPIECDALLPDYCPDIVAILKCAVTTHIGSTTISGNRLTIEGIATAHIYYTSDNHCIRHAEYKIPFGKAVDLRGAPADPVITVNPRVDYVNCRAVNQRRIDVRGALSIAVRVIDRKEEQVVSDAQGGGLQLRRDMVQVTTVTGQVQSPFNITEELEIGHGKAQVGSIVRRDCRISLQDYKVIAGKVVVKGEFSLHLLYQPVGEDSALEVMEYALPVSQIIDCDGAEEDSICDVQLIVASCDVQPKAGEDGEYRTITLDARIMAFITAHKHGDMPVVSDCYSTRYDCGCKHRPTEFVRLMNVVSETVMHKATLDLPEEVDAVLDAWCEVDQVAWKQEDEAISATLKLTVSMFARMMDGQCLYFEQAGEVEHAIALQPDAENISFDPTADILSSAYNLVGKEKIDIRCEVMLRGCIYSTVKRNAIVEIDVDEEKEKTKTVNKLCLYYAQEGESIWDIAKHYNTSAGAIWEENEVEQDVLTAKKMLFIPIL